MFSSIQPLLYVQISPELLTIHNVKTGASLAECPDMALSLSPTLKVLAVGVEAKAVAAAQSTRVVVNPFAHPRSLVSDFALAQALLKHQLERVMPRMWLRVSPCVVMHPLGSPAGGFTEVERAALREMAHGAGASQVNIWTGRPLTHQEVRSRRPPTTGGHWE
jgi:rod shape-determining protein MreB